MTWTEQDEKEFMEMVQRRRKLGIPFNPLGRGHKPPTDAELAASLPIKTRLEWVKDDLNPDHQASQQPDQPQDLDPAPDDPRSQSRPTSQSNPHHHEPDPDA